MNDVSRPLDGKVAMVTGGGTGIGRATAKLLAARGARLVVAGPMDDNLKSVVAEVEASGGSALAIPMDITVEATILAGMARAVEHFGGLDILHANAAQVGADALGKDGLIGDMDADFWDRTMQINLRGSMLSAKHAVPHMLKRGGGSIVFTGSGKGLLGDLDFPAYGTSKAALLGLGRYLATQYGKQGIRANVVVVGLVMTQALHDNLPPAAQDAMREHHLTPDLGRPEDIAEVVAFLASDQARFVTGSALVADGGFTAHSAVYADMRRWAAMAEAAE